MNDLAQFIRVRLDEDEAVARQAMHVSLWKRIGMVLRRFARRWRP